MVLEQVPVEERASIASFRWNIPLGFTAVAGTLALVRYHLFIATGWDLGFYEQALWALAAHGPAALSSWGGYPVMARSAAWILWPLSYPYRLFGVGFLLTLQAFAYGVGFVFLFDIAETERLSWPTIRLMGWIYILSPLAWGAVLFDFHPAVLAVPMLLGAYASWLRRRPQAALVWLVLALITQDLVAIVVLAAGLVLVLRDQRGAGTAAVALSLAMLAVNAWALHRLDPSVWIPAATYWGTVPAHWPELLLQGLRQVRSWLYLVWVLVPILIFGVNRRSWMWLLPVFALLLLNVSSISPAPTSPFTQYSILAVPFLLLAWMEAQAAPIRPLGRYRPVLVAVYVLFLLVFFEHESGLRHQTVPSAQAVALATAVGVVPNRAPVLTQNFVAPHVANRSLVASVTPGVLFPTAAYVILDTGHSTGLVSPAVVVGDVKLLSHSARTIFASGGVYVFEVTRTVRGVS